MLLPLHLHEWGGQFTPLLSGLDAPIGILFGGECCHLICSLIALRFSSGVEGTVSDNFLHSLTLRLNLIDNGKKNCAPLGISLTWQIVTPSGNNGSVIQLYLR